MRPLNLLGLSDNIAEHTRNSDKVRAQLGRRLRVEWRAARDDTSIVLVSPALDQVDVDVGGDGGVEFDFRGGDVAEGCEHVDLDRCRLVDWWLSKGVGCFDGQSDAVVCVVSCGQIGGCWGCGGQGGEDGGQKGGGVHFEVCDVDGCVGEVVD